MPLGFDEYIGFTRREQFRTWWFSDPKLTTNRRYRGAAVFRQPGGQWLLYAGTSPVRDGDFYFESKRTFTEWDVTASASLPEYALTWPVAEFFGVLYRCASDETPTSEERLWSPTIWTPLAQEEHRTALANSVSNILKLIRLEKASLADLSWRVVEEIVAEVLRRAGLEIHLVKGHPQGGRDIVARGQLIPGQEPIQLAVEVKHKAVVDRPEVQAALWQNRRYPALLFVTSGRFTSGVIREQQLPENKLRLFLKDGVALGDLIRDYTQIRT